MAKHVIHISEKEAAGDFASLMERVRAGAEVVIEENARPVAVVRPAESYLRLLSESLRLAREHRSSATLDRDFSKDVEAAIESHREPLNPLGCCVYALRCGDVVLGLASPAIGSKFPR